MRIIKKGETIVERIDSQTQLVSRIQKRAYMADRETKELEKVNERLEQNIEKLKVEKRNILQTLHAIENR